MSLSREWGARPLYCKTCLWDNFSSVTMKMVKQSVPFEVDSFLEMLIYKPNRVIRDLLTPTRLSDQDFPTSLDTNRLVVRSLPLVAMCRITSSFILF